MLTGRLDAVADYQGEFAILNDFYRYDGLQSSVMGWRVSNKTKAIWLDWHKAGMPKIVGGDQAWIEECKLNPDIWQKIAPDAFVSYKVTAGVSPDKAAVVVFHGLPRPHQVTNGWVPMVWKLNGMTRAELDAVCNTAKEEVHENIRSACDRDLKWFDFNWKSHDVFMVCRGGIGGKLNEHSLA